MAADVRSDADHALPGRLSQKLWFQILSWSLGWTIFMGGVGAALVLRDIRDARFRAELAVRGIPAIAIATEKRCGKSPNPIFRIQPDTGRAYFACAAEDYLPRFDGEYEPGARVFIMLQPGHPRLFVVAPGGLVPQRNLSGIWNRWRWRTLALLAIYIPITALALWISRRRKVP